MDYKRILKLLLTIGDNMLRSGAEVSRVEDSMYRMCRAYGFVHANVWVIYSNIQATVETKDGDIFTQIRHIPDFGVNFDRLDYLNNLSRTVCATVPDEDELERLLDDVLSRKQQPLWLKYAAGIMGGTGFAVFFDCDALDAVVAALASAFIIMLGERLSRDENNPLILNFIEAFFTEVIIIVAVHFGFGHHSSNITIGVVMLLISGLGFTNGIRDLLHKDTLSGILNIANSIIGAAGIAIGIAGAILILRGVM
jgi:uncharacterized membrane protein YjjP (DUF1212 family)